MVGARSKVERKRLTQAFFGLFTNTMHKLNSDMSGIATAARALLDGDLVAFPTETVYGLGAIANNDRAVARIFASKGRPSYNPLIVHVADRASASIFADFDERAIELADAFWPGPLTLVLPLKVHSAISRLVTAGLSTIAVRVPSHPVALAMLQQVELPIAAPSANASGSISPTKAQHVCDSLSDGFDFLLDGGPSSMGLESTVVDLSDAAEPGILLRPGSLAREDIEAQIGPLANVPKSIGIKSPGMLARHYAPKKPIRLNAKSAKNGEAVLTFGDRHIGGTGEVLNLSPQGDLTEAASNLYDMLWTLDGSNASSIAVVRIPKTGLGEAINDRLRRAATPAGAGSTRAPSL